MKILLYFLPSIIFTSSLASQKSVFEASENTPGKDLESSYLFFREDEYNGDPDHDEYNEFNAQSNVVHSLAATYDYSNLCVGVFNGYPNPNPWSFLMTYSGLYTQSKPLAYQQGITLCIENVPSNAYTTYYVCITAKQSNTGGSENFCTDIFPFLSTFVVKSTSATTLSSTLSVPYTTSFAPIGNAYFITWNIGSVTSVMNFTSLDGQDVSGSSANLKFGSLNKVTTNDQIPLYAQDMVCATPTTCSTVKFNASAANNQSWYLFYTGTDVAPGYPYTLVYFPVNTTASPLQGVSSRPTLYPTKNPVKPTAAPTGTSLCAGVYNALPNNTDWSFKMTYAPLPNNVAISAYLPYTTGANLCFPGVNSIATNTYQVNLVATPSADSTFQEVSWQVSIYGSNNAFFITCGNVNPCDPTIYLRDYQAPAPNNILNFLNLGPTQASLVYRDFVNTKKSFTSSPMSYGNNKYTIYYVTPDQNISPFYYNSGSPVSTNITSNTTFCVYPNAEPCSTYMLQEMTQPGAYQFVIYQGLGSAIYPYTATFWSFNNTPSASTAYSYFPTQLPSMSPTQPTMIPSLAPNKPSPMPTFAPTSTQLCIGVSNMFPSTYSYSFTLSYTDPNTGSTQYTEGNFIDYLSSATLCLPTQSTQTLTYYVCVTATQYNNAGVTVSKCNYAYSYMSIFALTPAYVGATIAQLSNLNTQSSLSTSFAYVFIWNVGSSSATMSFTSYVSSVNSISSSSVPFLNYQVLSYPGGGKEIGKLTVGGIVYNLNTTKPQGSATYIWYTGTATTGSYPYKLIYSPVNTTASASSSSFAPTRSPTKAPPPPLIASNIIDIVTIIFACLAVTISLSAWYIRTNSKIQLNTPSARWKQAFDILLRSAYLTVSVRSILTVISDTSMNKSYVAMIIVARVIQLLGWCGFLVNLFFVPVGDVMNQGTKRVELLQMLHMEMMQNKTSRYVFSGVLVLATIDVTFIRFLPWFQTANTKLLEGYPDLRIMRLCIYAAFSSQVFQSIASCTRFITVGGVSNGFSAGVSILNALRNLSTFVLLELLIIYNSSKLQDAERIDGEMRISGSANNSNNDGGKSSSGKMRNQREISMQISGKKAEQGNPMHMAAKGAIETGGLDNPKGSNLGADVIWRDSSGRGPRDSDDDSVRNSIEV